MLTVFLKLFSHIIYIHINASIPNHLQIWRNDNVHVEGDSSYYFLTLIYIHTNVSIPNNLHTLLRTPNPYNLNYIWKVDPPFWMHALNCKKSHEKNQRGLQPIIKLKSWILKKQKMYLEGTPDKSPIFSSPFLCTKMLIEDWLASISCLSIMSPTFSMSLLSSNT